MGYPHPGLHSQLNPDGCGLCMVSSGVIAEEDFGAVISKMGVTLDPHNLNTLFRYFDKATSSPSFIKRLPLSLLVKLIWVW